VKKAGWLALLSIYAGFHLLTAVYCLVAYVPFTYHEVRGAHLLPWLDRFVAIHSSLCLAMVGVVAPLLIGPWRRGGIARVLAAALAAVQFGLAFVSSVHPILANLENNTASLAWGALALAPLAGLAAAEIAAYAGTVEWTEKPKGQGIPQSAAWSCGVFVSLLYAGVLVCRGAARLPLPEVATAFGSSLLAHLVLFLAAFLALECISALAGLCAEPARVEFWACHLLLAGGIAFLLRTVVCPAAGFSGGLANLAALLLGGVLAALNAGVALWLAAGQALSDGIAAAAGVVTLGPTRSWWTPLFSVLLVTAAGGAIAVKSAALDWNYLLQKLTAAAVWLVSFGCFYTIGARRTKPRSVALVAVPLVVLGAYRGLEAAAPQAEPLLDHWAGYDASFLLARQFLTPPRPDGSFYQFLNQNTNIAASVHIEPVPVNLVETFRPVEEPPPHIFLFTIDSLRRDYLAPYNPAVPFTPAIAAFARESTVFENAFTRYGGTGLAEPSIWTGAMLLHKQYITPFAPMNALEKLISAEHCQVLISRDSILQTILNPAPGEVELDPPDAAMSLDFGRSLARLEDELKRREANAPPVFVYTQPQNLHVSVIQRERASVPAGEEYPGFYAPYASRVKRIDEAFGEFIAFLKQRGLYDRSIVVLTADHGDSLGEEGRWGHAYTLFPEIVRIPLIVHLPENLKAKYAADPGGLTFSIDVAPTLYYLLGQRPIEKNELFGQPLFTETPEERRRDPAAEYLLASSYGAVYGILGQGGRRLFIADGVNYRDYLFDITPTAASPRSLDARFEQEQQELIRKRILAIDRFYHFGNGGQP